MPNLLGWRKLLEGMHIQWPFSFTNEDIVAFAKLSGDHNPIHVDIDFAKSKGFEAPLVYGLLLSSQVSRLIGQELPDKNAILTGIEMDFMHPSFSGDELIFEADLINKSEATFAIEFKCRISKGGKTLCQGKVNAIWKP